MEESSVSASDLDGSFGGYPSIGLDRREFPVSFISCPVAMTRVAQHESRQKGALGSGRNDVLGDLRQGWVMRGLLSWLERLLVTLCVFATCDSFSFCRLRRVIEMDEEICISGKWSGRMGVW